ncbi:MAG: Cys-tRNA(Pro) deacylase [Bacillota bacterium]|jgi:Cys-tRNA(Pro)/Cys-tRNA(Cys) deacylase
MAKKINKTNAMRALDKLKLPYECNEYQVTDGKIDGVSVAEKIGKLPDEVFKTLVTQSPDRNYYIFVVPVDHELSLKKCAKACGEKSVEMIAVKDITKVTGYIRGGCSPLAMKKQYPTFIHESAAMLPAVTFSGGKIGVQITMNPNDLLTACGGVFADLTDF